MLPIHERGDLDTFSDGTPVNKELPPGACGECDECEQGNRCREIPEPDEEAEAQAHEENLENVCIADNYAPEYE
tara:strand:+ start:227 stop:448 length:222 start_codon:yes stop_codon:yes gene_type:complete